MTFDYQCLQPKALLIFEEVCCICQCVLTKVATTNRHWISYFSYSLSDVSSISVCPLSECCSLSNDSYSARFQLNQRYLYSIFSIFVIEDLLLYVRKCLTHSICVYFDLYTVLLNVILSTGLFAIHQFEKMCMRTRQDLMSCF